jgi:hypothetical protein
MSTLLGELFAAARAVSTPKTCPASKTNTATANLDLLDRIPRVSQKLKGIMHRSRFSNPQLIVYLLAIMTGLSSFYRRVEKRHIGLWSNRSV